MQSEAPSVCSFVPLDWHPTSSARPGRGQEISPPENPLKSPLLGGLEPQKKQGFLHTQNQVGSSASRISSAFSNLAASAAETLAPHSMQEMPCNPFPSSNLGAAQGFRGFRTPADLRDSESKTQADERPHKSESNQFSKACCPRKL